jgi:hypothetical protein
VYINTHASKALVRRNRMIMMTPAKALEVQARQVAHYSARYPQVAALVAAATNVSGLEMDKEYDVATLNRHIPRGGKIEDLLGVDFS